MSEETGNMGDNRAAKPIWPGVLAIIATFLLAAFYFPIYLSLSLLFNLDDNQPLWLAAPVLLVPALVSIYWRFRHSAPTPKARWFLIAGILGLAVAPRMLGMHVESLSGEAKQNTHAISQALERYATDVGYAYPLFLIGGELLQTSNREVGEFNPNDSSDILSALGYMPAYPYNPFVIRSIETQTTPTIPLRTRMRNLWWGAPNRVRTTAGSVANTQQTASDPYGLQNPQPRFGSEFRQMGNVAADHRFEDGKWGYAYWERNPDKPNMMNLLLQGQFYYKALIPPGETEPKGYILMVFGACDDEGEDAFTTVPGGHELDGRLPDGSGVGMGVPVIPELGLEPDGKRDGVILVLHGGWPWEEPEKTVNPGDEYWGTRID